MYRVDVDGVHPSQVDGPPCLCSTIRNSHTSHIHVGHHFANVVQRAVRIEIVRMPPLRNDVLRPRQRQRHRQQFRHHRMVRDQRPQRRELLGESLRVARMDGLD